MVPATGAGPLCCSADGPDGDVALAVAARFAEERLQHREADAQDREVQLEDGVVDGLHRRAVVVARVVRVHDGFEAEEGHEDRPSRGVRGQSIGHSVLGLLCACSDSNHEDEKKGERGGGWEGEGKIMKLEALTECPA